MALTITKRVEPRTIETHVVTCDKCGAVYTDRSGFDVHEVSIECQTGSSYPESSNVQGLRTDCCAVCFKKYVVPVLEAAGFTFRTVDRGW